MRRFLIVLITIAGLALADSWWRMYDASEVGLDIGWWAQGTPDGGFIVAGVKHDGTNHGIFKTDAKGNPLWFRDYGGGIAYCVKHTLDGGFIIGGVKKDSIQVLKVDAQGSEVWSYTYKDVGAAVYCIQIVQDGGYVAVGSAFLKVDENGTLEWLREYDVNGIYLSQTDDGGYIVCGKQESKLWLLKTLDNGKIEWEHLYSISTVDCMGYGIHQTSDGGYLIGASSFSSVSRTWEVVFLKTNSDGNSLWCRVYDDPGQDYCYSLEPTSDGNFIASGITSSYGAGNYDVWFMKIDPNGNKLWKRYWGGPGEDQAYHAEETSDCGFIITGTTTSYGAQGSDLLLIKTNAWGGLPIEISPEAILVPYANRHYTVLTPKARFRNKSSSSYTHNVYYHCEIVGLDHHGSDYHDSVMVEGGPDPWKTVEIEFSEWKAEYVSAYRSTFWAEGTGGYTFPSEPMSVTFSRKTDIAETPTGAPSWKILKSVGREIVLSYRDYPHGFSAIVFDASGRKVDNLHSLEQSGTICWGKGYENGVYLIHIEGQSFAKVHKVILLN